jgi:hypothetical protein
MVGSSIETTSQNRRAVAIVLFFLLFLFLMFFPINLCPHPAEDNDEANETLHRQIRSRAARFPATQVQGSAWNKHRSSVTCSASKDPTESGMGGSDQMVRGTPTAASRAIKEAVPKMAARLNHGLDRCCLYRACSGQP